MVFYKKGQLSKYKMNKLKLFIRGELSLIGSSSDELTDMSLAIFYILNGKKFTIKNDFDIYNKADKILSLKVKFTQHQEDYYLADDPVILDEIK